MFKVGDSVRITGNRDGLPITIDKIYIVESIDFDDNYYPIRVVGDDDEPWWIHKSDFEAATSKELTDLRAWKANALARFPALERPETDDEAAERLVSGMIYGNDDLASAARIKRIVLDAFKWARNNPA